MKIHVDLRCLQDAAFAFRGVGFHTASILAHCRPHLPAQARLIGIVDPQLGVLPDGYRELVDECRVSASSVSCMESGVFLQPSPMTHEPAPVAGLLNRPRLLSCAVVYDFIPLDEEERYLATPEARRSYLAGLAWLRRYHLFFPISASTSRRLHEVLGVR